MVAKACDLPYLRTREKHGDQPLKCPQCGSELTPSTRHGVATQICASCKGMWLERQDLAKLEDEQFFLGEHAKGTLVADAQPTEHKCPQCGAALTRFNYRFNDLQLELCPNQHGFWLDQGEDDRILQIMNKEQHASADAIRAEDRWAKALQDMRSGSFLDRMKDKFDDWSAH